MARKVRSAELDTREARSKLRGRGKPYYRAVEEGAHLGYRKPRGRKGKPAGAGKWCSREYDPAERSYTVATIGVADDLSDADGVAILNYWQACERVRERMVRRAHDAAGVGSPLTVERAVEAYLEGLGGKAASDARHRARAHIYPKLGNIEIASLSRDVLSKWLATLAKTPARVRSKAGKPQQHQAFDPANEETVRRRKSSANRTWTILRAALNLAFRDGHVTSDAAWRKVKPFKGVDAARVRYLTVEEAKRLINASDPAFRLLVQAALATGCRFGELIRLEVADFNPDAGTLAIRRSKSGKPRHVVLTDEGVALFQQFTAGRATSEIMLRKANGEAWRTSNQLMPIRQACLRAKIDPPINFHVLRHTWASLAVMAGMPLLVVARNMGHADGRMTEKHYGHLAPSYIADAIREHAPKFGLKLDRTVTPLRR